MMIKSVKWGVWCCQVLALSVGCARIEGAPGSSPGGGQTGSGSGPGQGSGGGSGSGPLGTGGSTRGTVAGGLDGGATCDDVNPQLCPGKDAPVCGFFPGQVERLPPDVLIVLDRSLSMNGQVLPPGFDLGMFVTCLLLNNCPMTSSKWVTMTGALNSSVMATATTVNYGLKFFPTDAACGVTDGVAVPIAANNFAPMNGAIAMTQPGGFTPTAAALASAGRYLATLTRPNPRFVVLATDGEPTCGAGGDTMTSDAQAAVNAVTDLARAGIPVYVIGIATQGMADTTLNDMATAGGKPRNANPLYYPVQTASDLSMALSAIGKDVVSCTFTVTPPAPPASPTNVAVDANGSMRVPQSDTDGWKWGANMTSIVIVGSWCDRIQSGAITKVQATYACEGIVIPPIM